MTFPPTQVKVSGQVDFNTAGLLLREDCGKVWNLIVADKLLIGDYVSVIGSITSGSTLIVSNIVGTGLDGHKP